MGCDPFLASLPLPCVFFFSLRHPIPNHPPRYPSPPLLPQDATPVSPGEHLWFRPDTPGHSFLLYLPEGDMLLLLIFFLSTNKVLRQSLISGCLETWSAYTFGSVLSNAFRIFFSRSLKGFYKVKGQTTQKGVFLKAPYNSQDEFVV